MLQKLRALILSIDKNIAEEIKWDRPCYSAGGDLFCYLQNSKNHISLGFHLGTSLKDESQLLEGTGKNLRHIKFKVMDQINADQLTAMLKEAFKLSINP